MVVEYCKNGGKGEIKKYFIMIKDYDICNQNIRKLKLREKWDQFLEFLIICKMELFIILLILIDLFDD
jgi:hypothetical protein